MLAKLMGDDGKGGKGSPFGDAMSGAEGLLGALNPKPSAAAQAETQRLEPSHPGMVANSSEAIIPQMSSELMQNLLQNKRRNYGMTLTG
jgi:hypothetical protein